MFHLNPEYRSLTSVIVVEDATRVPLGFSAISKTHDGDLDADLWRDGFFTRVTRYVCVSKTQGRPEHVVQDMRVLQDRESPPDGYTVVQQTADSSAKTFKKKQLVYKLAHFKTNVESICDLIIVSKVSKAPEEYLSIGDVNGMNFMVRKISAITRMQTPALPYGVMPALYPNLSSSINNIKISSPGNDVQMPMMPSNTSPGGMPTPYPMSPPFFSGSDTMRSNSSTLSTLTGLEGVSFSLRDDLKGRGTSLAFSRIHSKAPINFKTRGDIDAEYWYDFQNERDALQSSLFNNCIS